MAGMGIDRWIMQQQSHAANWNKSYGTARRGMEGWGVGEWEKYAQGSAPKYQMQAGTFYSNPMAGFKAWGGGYLSPQDYTRATWAQQQAIGTEVKRAHEEGKAANLARYQEILTGYRDRYQQAISQMEGLGKAEKYEIQHRYNIERSRAMQGLLSSGLLTSTVAPAVSRQISAQEGRDIGMLNERLRRERIGYTTGLKEDELRFMERREDTYPELMQYYELLRKLGAA